MKTIDSPSGHESASAIDWDLVHRRMAQAKDALEKSARRSPEEERDVLKKRARALAEVPLRIDSREQGIDILEFRLSQETYGIESAWVAEVYPLKEITTLPCTPPFVLGIINVRGKILSVIDLKKFFNLPEKGLGDLNKIIILRNDTMEFGILADIIVQTRSIGRDALGPIPPTVTGIGAQYLQGVTSTGMIVLDGKTILNDEKIIVNETVSET